MSAVKERLLGAITVMNEEDAEQIWFIIKNRFSSPSWDFIQEEEPDEIDKKMLKEIADNPDCHEFLSSDEVMKALDL